MRNWDRLSTHEVQEIILSQAKNWPGVKSGPFLFALQELPFIWGGLLTCPKRLGVS